jgi:hypothetical protein
MSILMVSVLMLTHGVLSKFIGKRFARMAKTLRAVALAGST